MKKEAYFDASKYPVIRFVSTAVESLGKNQVLVKGKLTIKNITREIDLNVYVTEGIKMVYFAKLKLNRRDYGVGSTSWILSDNADIEIKIIEKN